MIKTAKKSSKRRLGLILDLKGWIRDIRGDVRTYEFPSLSNAKGPSGAAAQKVRDRIEIWLKNRAKRGIRPAPKKVKKIGFRALYLEIGIKFQKSL